MKNKIILISFLIFIVSFSTSQEKPAADKVKKEDSKKETIKYIDKNGDGINDIKQIESSNKGNMYGKMGKGNMQNKKDVFIDEDGDGICDFRAKGMGFKFGQKGFMKNQMGKTKR